MFLLIGNQSLSVTKKKPSSYNCGGLLLLSVSVQNVYWGNDQWEYRLVMGEIFDENFQVKMLERDMQIEKVQILLTFLHQGLHVLVLSIFVNCILWSKLFFTKLICGHWLLIIFTFAKCNFFEIKGFHDSLHRFQFSNMNCLLIKLLFSIHFTSARRSCCSYECYW